MFSFGDGILVFSDTSSMLHGRVCSRLSLKVCYTGVERLWFWDCEAAKIGISMSALSRTYYHILIESDSLLPVLYSKDNYWSCSLL